MKSKLKNKELLSKRRSANMKNLKRNQFKKKMKVIFLSLKTHKESSVFLKVLLKQVKAWFLLLKLERKTKMTVSSRSNGKKNLSLRIRDSKIVLILTLSDSATQFIYFLIDIHLMILIWCVGYDVIVISDKVAKLLWASWRPTWHIRYPIPDTLSTQRLHRVHLYLDSLSKSHV